MESHQLINQSSGDVEIYTPSEIIEPAREFLGAIDLDPASSLRANERVRAAEIFTEPPFAIIGEMLTTVGETVTGPVCRCLPVRYYYDRGGLDRPWCGRVWLNPPFILPDTECVAGCSKRRCVKRGWHTATALPGTTDWIDKIGTEYAAGRITAACCITFAATSEAWFQPLLRRPVCFPAKRTNYLLPDGTVYAGVTKGSAVTCFGSVPRFAAAFGHLGEIKVSFNARPLQPL